MKNLFVFLTGLTAQDFYGVVHIHFTDGRIKLVKVDRDYKPDALPLPTPAAVARFAEMMRPE